jgi:hypothetical protein
VKSCHQAAGVIRQTFPPPVISRASNGPTQARIRPADGPRQYAPPGCAQPDAYCLNDACRHQAAIDVLISQMKCSR